MGFKFDISQYPNVKWIAHRGLTSKTDENTVTAFKMAGELPFYGIETDVHETLDSKYILYHDDFVKISDQKIFIDKTLSIDLKNIIFNNGDTLPDLEDYIKICKKYQKIAVLELKAPFTTLKIKNIIEKIETLGYLEQTIFISFYIDNLLRVKLLRKESNCQLLLGDYNDALITLSKSMKFDINIHYSHLTPTRVDYIHSLGLQVNCWTVNDKDIALKLIEMGVDFITTDGFYE
ncbi:hypothetical protein JV173_03365 [Acholeplasma equirhinis]|uniref:glycerophosphodiester phosphodiesterase n=1 Tax=Acholeplasma equirhinis TaxID=555393 RepID=UPI00197A8E61|nr:glycerophosphodiester phosphodiesterase family protein [Acholeplasma equirhinis]MBN3490548.1 hypothetical protein [Acholeplasma equirhinis]